MRIKKVILFILFFTLVGLVLPRTSKAFDLQDTLASENSIITKFQEGLEYFFAFKVENKVQVLEKHAEKRLTMAQEYAEEGNNERVQNLIQSYQQIKEKQENLLGKVNGQVLGAVAENTIDQQKTMEEIKTKTSNEIKQEIIQVQERVVNQVAERIVVENGPEGQTEFFQKVEHVWAPGTGPGGDVGTTYAPGTSGTGSGGVTIEGGEMQLAPGTTYTGQSGVVIEGGTIRFAPGTSGGGPSGADIKTVEVKTGGGENNVVEGGSEGGLAPGTTLQGGENTIDPGSVDPGDPGSESWVIDP